MSQQSFMHEVLASDTQWHLGVVSSWKHLWVHGLAKTNPLPCMPYDSIYSKWGLWNWKEFRDSLVEECCAFELQSLTFHPLCPDHASDKKSVARGSACPFYHHQISRPECQRVISGQHGDDARPNNHLALRRSHLAISVCQADRGVKLRVQEGCVSAHDCKPAPNVITSLRVGKEHQLLEAHCIFHYSSTFFPPLFVLIN